MIIREYQHKDKQNWDEYVFNHPHGLPYHLSAWKSAVEDGYRFKGCYLIAEPGSGNNDSIIGVLPLIHHHHHPYARGELISLPFCDAAGPLADSEEIENALIREAIKIGCQNRIEKISIRSTRPFPGMGSEHTLNNRKVRMLLSLPDSSETLMASFKAKLRSQIKKPKRDGLTAQIGSTQLLDAFYPLFLENMRDLGSPVHSIKWLKSVLKAYENRAHIVLVQMPDGTPAAGGLILCHPNQVSVPWASSLRRFNRWNPNMLLYWTLLKFACDMGFPVFDFGRSTPGEGTYLFKKQWGAVPSELHWADSNFTDDQFQSNNVSRQMAEGVLKHLPLAAMKFIGPRVRKYISL